MPAKGFRKETCIRDHKNFGVDNRGGRFCITCREDRSKKWKQDNPEGRKEHQHRHYVKHAKQVRDYDLKRLGWSLEKFNDQLQIQGNKCAICEKELIGPRQACADHKHSTTPVPRDILCQSCNKGLGNFKDCIRFLLKAVAYLERHGEKP